MFEIDNIRKKEGGFTIVEVMIVLAIAGLVLAIVFIAVPNLQRNARNNARRADLALLRAQVDTWTSNNNGKLPETNANLLSIVGSTGWSHYNGNDPEPISTTSADNVVQTGIGEYRVHMFTDNAAAIPATTLVLPGRQEIHIHTQKQCAVGILALGNDIDITAATNSQYAAANADIADSNARAIAFVYQVEGEDNARCEDNT